jgi:drug/metabolite transporter (DMT)-like permease
MALVMLGVILLTRIYNIGAGGVTWIGAGAGLLSGLSYAVFIFGFRYAAPHGSPQAILMIAFAVLVAILIWLSDADQTTAALISESWPLFAVLGVLGAGLSFIFYVVGMNYTAPAVASIVAMVEPVTAALFGFMVLNETLIGSQIFGMVLILVTVTVLSVYSSTR